MSNKCCEKLQEFYNYNIEAQNRTDELAIDNFLKLNFIPNIFSIGIIASNKFINILNNNIYITIFYLLSIITFFFVLLSITIYNFYHRNIFDEINTNTFKLMNKIKKDNIKNIKLTNNFIEKNSEFNKKLNLIKKTQNILIILNIIFFTIFTTIIIVTIMFSNIEKTNKIKNSHINQIINIF